MFHEGSLGFEHAQTDTLHSHEQAQENLGSGNGSPEEPHHGQHDQGRTGQRVAGVGGRAAKELDQGGIEEPADGLGDRDGHQEGRPQRAHGSADVGDQAEHGEQEAGDPPDLPDGGTRRTRTRQLNQGSIEQDRHGLHLRPRRGVSFGPSGFRTTCCQDLCGGEDHGAGVLQLGDGHSPRLGEHPSVAVRKVVGDACGQEREGVHHPEGEDRTSKCEATRGSTGEHISGEPGAGDTCGDAADPGGGAVTADRGVGHEGRATTEEGRRWRGEQWELLPGDGLGHGGRGRPSVEAVATVGMPKEASGGAPPEVRPLSKARATFLENEACAIGPLAFEALTRKGPTWLIEVACSPSSLLSQEVQQVAGYESAAIRCAHWNGCDLETKAGVSQVIRLINEHRPRHVWISTECGPYSPMQSVNQRNEAQKNDLAEKRRKVLKQYLGGCAVYQHCMQMGIHATWEWAQKSHAWRLPFMQRLDKKYVPYYAVTQGCQVGLKDPRSDRLMHKGWKIMTSHARLAEQMHMPCRCGHEYHHAKCEGSLAGSSAFYTQAYVRRVCRVLQQELSQEGLTRELEGRTSLLSMFGGGSQRVCSELQSHGSPHVCGMCATATDGELCTQRPTEEAMVMRQAERMTDEEIKKKLYLLHAATGHGSTRNLVEALRRRQAPTRVLELAEKFECSVCQEKRRIQHKHVASLETLPPKLATVSADGGRWTHPTSQEEIEFVCAIDEGSRFRVTKVLKKGRKQTMSASDFLAFLDEHWVQYFGLPHNLRVDPSGAFRSREVEAYCEARGIYLDIIAGEAHWQLGTCEQAIRGLKEVMTKLAETEPELEVERLLAEATRTFNHRELIRGFSPVQHLMGRCPDETNRMIDGLTERGPEPILEPASGAVQRSIELQQQAEMALSRWQAQQRLGRALNSRAQREHVYRPGDLVYFWRKQVSGRATGKNGCFQGPARILAMETKPDGQGGCREGSAIWCIKGRRLLKCAAAQLRPASQREELLEHLSKEDETRAPWTFPRLVESLGGNEFEDLTREQPDAEEWETAQDPSQRVPVVRYRHTTKRSVDDVTAETEAAKFRRSTMGRPEMDAQAEAAWWTTIEENEFAQDSHKSRWRDQSLSVEIGIDLPTTRSGQQAMSRDLAGYFMNQMKRRSIEVSEKHMTEEDKAAFKEAKAKEVRNFIAAQAFEALPPELRPSRDQAITMRWILTWKKTDNGGQKAKARAILKGYQDPGYEHRATTTPVMTRQTRQLLLQLAAWRQWKVKKGDVSGAFLQGREYPGELYCIPCPEILEAMGLGPNEITRVKKGCYGLVDAPLEWYKSVSEFFETLRLVKSWADPCCWLWKPNGQLKGMIAGHVDDFLFAGPPECSAWRDLEKKIQEHYKWTEWESKSFVQCGVQIEEQHDGSFHLSQPNYLQGVSEINLTASRRREKNLPTTEREKSLLRAALGALSWHAQQVAPHLSAEVGLLLSDVTASTVETISRTNHLLYLARQRKGHKLVIHAFTPETKLMLYVWADAAGQNRRDGGSTQGLFVGIGPESLLHGHMECISPIAWHAGRIDRVTRSPGAAEARAVVNGEDYLFHARFQLGEMLLKEPDIFNVDATVREVPGCLISDSRNVYDKLQTEELSAKGAERRTDIELMCLKASQRSTGLVIR